MGKNPKQAGGYRVTGQLGNPLPARLRNKFGAAQGAAATAPPHRILRQPINQGGAPLLLLQVLEVRDPLGAGSSLRNQKASPTTKQWSPWGREVAVVSKAVEDTVESTEGGQGNVWCHCAVTWVPSLQPGNPTSHARWAELQEGAALPQPLLALVPQGCSWKAHQRLPLLFFPFPPKVPEWWLDSYSFRGRSREGGGVRQDSRATKRQVIV